MALGTCKAKMLSDFPINVVDAIILASLLCSGLLALGRGFVKEALSIAGWVLAAFSALTWFPVVQPFVQMYVGQALIAGSISFVVIFVVVLTVASYISSAISRRVRHSEISVLDRSLGFLFGLLRGALVIALGYLVVVQFIPATAHPEWLRMARALPAIEYSAHMLARLTPNDISKGLASIDGIGRIGARNLGSKLDDAINVGKAAEKLKALATDKDKNSDKGYTRGSREDLNRLIQNRTKN